MTNIQENQLSRDLAISEVFEVNIINWNKIEPLAVAIAKLKSNIKERQSYRQGQVLKRKGIARNKKSVKVDLINAAYKISTGVIGLASATDNTDLKEKISYTKYELEKSRDTVLYDKCNLIYKTAYLLKNEIATFFITEDDFVELNSLIEEYLTAIPQPRLAIGDNKNITTRLAELSVESETLIKDKIDGMMLSFEHTKSDFYNAYFSARKVVKAGTHKVSIAGKIINKKNGNAIQGAIILNIENDHTSKSGKKGGFRQKSLLPGKYELTVTMKGFVTATFTVDVVEGKTTHVVFEIEKA